MRAARLCLAGVIVVCAVLLAAVPAQAGGQLWDLDGQPSGESYYEPGSMMTARGGVYLWDGRGRNDRGAYHAGPEHGPFYFYISKMDDGVGWGPYAPPLPKDAQLMGDVVLKQRDETTWDASGSFTLPDLAPGNYMLHHCNDPCTRQLSDIMSTPFTIIEDVDQAPLWRRLEGTRERLRNRFQDMDTLQVRVDQLSDFLRNQSGRLRDNEESLRSEIASLRQEIKELRSERRSGIAQGSLAGLALGALILAAWRFRTD